MYVPLGSRLVYSANIPVTTEGMFISPADLITKIAGDLANNQQILIEDSSYDNPLLSGPFSVTLNLLTQDTDYASENDVKSIVDHYFYTEVNTLPSSSRIVSVTVPGGTAQATGAPGVPVTPPNSNPVTSFFSNIDSGLAGLGIGALAVIGLLVFVAFKTELL